MDCYRCGAHNGPEAAFCARCGTPTGYGPPTVPNAPSNRHRNENRVLIAAATIAVLVVAVAAGIVLLRSDGDKKSAAPTLPVTTSSSGQVRDVQGTASAQTSPAATSGTAATTVPRDFASIYAAQQSGVVRIEVVGCSDSGIGTGFLLSPTLVATVEHVVAEATVVSLVDGDQRATGRVIGSDPTTDLALVQADRPLTGFHFTFTATPARVGDRVAAIGFPIGGPISLTQGGVSGLDRVIPIDGTTRSGLIQTDTAINPGNSGGPLLGADGTVVGLVDAKDTTATGIGYAIPAAQAQPRMTSWTQSPQTQAAPTCSTPTGPDQSTQVSIEGLSPEASSGITATFEKYFDGINSADYASALAALSPHRRPSLASFRDALSTSFDTDVVVLGANQVDAGTVHITLRFVSLQDAGKGPKARPSEKCTQWSLVYTMTDIGGTWFIDGNRPYHGTASQPC